MGNQYTRPRQWENWAQIPRIAEEMVSLGSELALRECQPLSGGMADIEQATLGALIQQRNDYRQELINIKTSIINC